MNQTEALEIIKVELDRYKKLFCLEDWDIRVYFARLEKDTPAEVDTYSAYKQAHITFDLEVTDNKHELVKNLRHELLHITTANFDHLVNVAKKGLSEQQSDMLDEVYDYQSEQIVNLLERILGRLDLSLLSSENHNTIDGVNKTANALIEQCTKQDALAQL